MSGPLVRVLPNMENSAPSLKIFPPCKIVEIKIGGKNPIKNILKQLFHSTLLDMK